MAFATAIETGSSAVIDAARRMVARRDTGGGEGGVSEETFRKELAKREREVTAPLLAKIAKLEGKDYRDAQLAVTKAEVTVLEEKVDKYRKRVARDAESIKRLQASEAELQARVSELETKLEKYRRRVERDAREKKGAQSY
jgi:ABC-type phosphate transport system auxiliary subunit